MNHAAHGVRRGTKSLVLLLLFNQHNLLLKLTLHVDDGVGRDARDDRAQQVLLGAREERVGGDLSLQVARQHDLGKKKKILHGGSDKLRHPNHIKIRARTALYHIHRLKSILKLCKTITIDLSSVVNSDLQILRRR